MEGPEIYLTYDPSRGCGSAWDLFLHVFLSFLQSPAHTQVCGQEAAALPCRATKRVEGAERGAAERWAAGGIAWGKGHEASRFCARGG